MAEREMDVEKGLGDNLLRNIPLPGDTRRPSINIPKLPEEGSVDVAHRLARYRSLVGIHTRPDLVSTDIRPAANLGLYQRTVKAEKKYGKQFRLFSFMINAALGLQIVFAAALTALGASGASQTGKNANHTTNSQAVTAFGAMNTILAGFLTFLKGSGLPNRLKYFHDEWVKVRIYIEQRERDFARIPCDLDLEEEVFKIERMFEDVKKDIELNTPDSFVSISAVRRTTNIAPEPQLAHRVASEVRRLKDMEDDASRRTTDTVDGAEKKVRIVVEDEANAAHRWWENTGTRARQDLSATERDVSGRVHQTESDLSQQVQQTGSDLSQRVHQTQSDLSNRVQQTESQAQHSLDRRVAETEAGIDRTVAETEHHLDRTVQETEHRLEHKAKEGEHGITARLRDAEDRVSRAAERAVERLRSHPS